MPNDTRLRSHISDSMSYSFEGDIQPVDRNENEPAERDITCHRCYNNSLLNNPDMIFQMVDIEVYGNGLILCEDCLSNICNCHGCNREYYRGDLLRYYRDNQFYCRGCNPIRDIYFHPKFVQLDRLNNTFNKIEFKQCFGIELEVDCRNIMFNKVIEKTNFGSCHDGSVDNGVEFVSPILQGDWGYKQIKRLCKYLRGKNISHKCGYHVHFDGRDYDWQEIKKIWAVYKVLEPIIQGLMPKSRTNNHYCRPIRQSFERIMSIDSNNELYEVWYDGFWDDEYDEEPHEHKYNESRYTGFNLHAWFYQQTIEVRYHTGTTDFNKIINWIKLNKKIIDFALASDFDTIKKLKNRVARIKEVKVCNSKKIIKLISEDSRIVKYYVRRFKHLRVLDIEAEQRRLKRLWENYWMNEVDSVSQNQDRYDEEILRANGFNHRYTSNGIEWYRREVENNRADLSNDSNENCDVQGLDREVLQNLDWCNERPLIRIRQSFGHYILFQISNADRFYDDMGMYLENFADFPNNELVLRLDRVSGEITVNSLDKRIYGVRT